MRRGSRRGRRPGRLRRRACDERPRSCAGSRSRCPRASSWSRPRALVERLRRARTTAEIEAIAARGRAGRRGLRGARPARASSGAPSATSRSRIETPCASSAPRGSRSRRSSPRARTARCRTPSRATRDRAGRARRPRPGRDRRRLLLRLHAHLRDRRDRRPSSARGLRAGARGAAGRRSRRSRPGADGREVDAVAASVIAAGRPRRALRPRPRSRRRHRGPRGAAPVGPLRGRRCAPATSSPSSRASTCRARSACGSRISSSSAPTGSATSARAPRSSRSRADHRSSQLLGIRPVVSRIEQSNRVALEPAAAGSNADEHQRTPNQRRHLGRQPHERATIPPPARGAWAGFALTSKEGNSDGRDARAGGGCRLASGRDRSAPGSRARCGRG